jgi:hypothetical protein
MTTTIEIGDLVRYKPNYNEYKYGNIIKILDQDNNSHQEYNLITGWRYKNSKLKITVNFFGEEKPLSNDITYITPYTYTLTEMETLIDTYFFNKERIIIETNSIKKEINVLNSKMQFLNKHQNITDIREDKLNYLIK